MPYYLANADESADTLDCAERTAYHDRQTAHGACTDGLRVLYVPSEIETIAWQTRERFRIADGTYRPVPWADVDRYPGHFAHLAIEVNGMIAYTADDESGHLGRKIRTRPGRYLEKFYADVPLATRNAWIGACVAPVFSIATTADEIETVYRNAVGFRSCMGPDSHARFTVHPTRVYGDSDLAVAYLGPIDEALARCVIWPAKKIHSRIYGLDAKLRHALRAVGYQDGDLDGARIRAIKRGIGYVMPYIDGADSARASGDGFLTLCDNGDINVKTQTGRSWSNDCAHCGDPCDGDETYCESCYNDRYDCERCGDECFDSDSAPYCASCNDERNVCDHCHEDTFDTVYQAIGRRGYEITVCEHCADHDGQFAFTCVHCDCEESEAKYRIRDQKRRRDSGVALTLCDDCDTSGVVLCADCETSRESNVPLCENCAVGPRCAKTGDLLATLEMS